VSQLFLHEVLIIFRVY